MKKLLIATVGLGLIVVSCGTKESTMSTKNSDSAKVSEQTVRQSAIDSVSSKRMNPDTVKFKSDSTAVVAPAK